MLLGDDELLAWVDEAAVITVAAATAAGPDAPITTCAGWLMSDLVGHVAPLFSGLYSYGLHHAPEEADFWESLAAPEMPDTYPERVEYLRAACEGFTALARAVDLDAPVWACWMTQPARYWLLRAATELAVHSWDAQSALGERDRLTPDRAATSVDETLRGLWPANVELCRRGILADRPLDLPVEAIGIIATDSGHAWRVYHVGGDIAVTGTDNLPPTAPSDTGHDLVRYLWGRLTSADLDVAGDRSLADAWNLCPALLA